MAGLTEGGYGSCNSSLQLVENVVNASKSIRPQSKVKYELRTHGDGARATNASGA